MKEQKAMSQKPKGEKRKTGKTNGRKTTPEVITATPSSQHSPPEIVEGQIVQLKKTLPPTARKKPGTLDRKTQKALDLAVNHGVTPKDAYTLVNGKVPTPATLTRFKQKVSKHSLQAPGMAKLAHQVVKDALMGVGAAVHQQAFDKKTGKVVDFTETIAPTFTNRLVAAAMVVDRVDPLVRRSENLNVNVDCSPVDLEKYRNR